MTADRYVGPYWGDWLLNVELMTLNLYHDETGNHRYEIDLEKCTTSAEVLDYIMQIAKKGWCTDSILASLVRALDDILQPQRHLCSFGFGTTNDDVASQVARFM